MCKITKIMDIRGAESVKLRLPIFNPTMHEYSSYHSLAARPPPDSRIKGILGRLSQPFSLKDSADMLQKFSLDQNQILSFSFSHIRVC